MELRNPTPPPGSGEASRQIPTQPDGAMVEHAMKCARLEAKQLADAMGVSASFLLRGFKDAEHCDISWQRLQRACAVYPKFRRELLRVQAANDKGVSAYTVIQIPEWESA